jgi:hypothetical protein
MNEALKGWRGFELEDCGVIARAITDGPTDFGFRVTLPRRWRGAIVRSDRHPVFLLIPLLRRR